MVFKSKQVNTDPKPWVHHYDSTDRSSSDDLPGGLRDYKPRPEFNVTRDSEPWALRQANGTDIRMARREDFMPITVGIRFDPRPEHDHPVNRILSGIREDVANSADLGHDVRATAEYWLSFSDDWDKDGLTATPDEIDHARRVLTRLAEWQRPATGTSSAIETREDT